MRSSSKRSDEMLPAARGKDGKSEVGGARYANNARARRVVRRAVKVLS